jgi:hypothetical protein
VFLQTRPVDRLMTKFGDPRGLGADCRIAVCGTHRSGTTLLGTFFTADPRSRQIFEPFNPAFGIEEATHSFIAGDWPDNPWHDVIDRFLAADGVKFRTPVIETSPFARWLKGTRAAREFAAARLFRPQRLVFKCPFMTLSSQYLIDRHDIQVVFTVKHPLSFFASLRRVGWHEDLPLDDMVEQGVIDAASRDAATTPAARAGLFWSILNRHALETLRRFPESTTIWSHERFCRDPHEEMARVTAALNIAYSPAMRQEVAQATSGAVVVPAGSKVHELVRNAAGMVDEWRGRVSPEEEAELRAYCGALYEEIVGEGW